MSERVALQFADTDGNITGPTIDCPVTCGTQQLTLILNSLLSAEEPVPYSFYIDTHEIVGNLNEAMNAANVSIEETVKVIYHPQAVFSVKPVTRCSADLPGHQEAILCTKFHPSGQQCASGSGDRTIRLWDINTQTPRFKLEGHKNWVLTISYSPDGELLASGGMDNEIFLWRTNTGQKIPKTLKGHTKRINSISWEPYHMNSNCRRLVSASADGTTRIWDVVSGSCLTVLSGHTKCVTDVIWGGCGVIYTSSEDTTIRLWESKTYECLRILKSHGHWVNSLSLSTSYALRTGPYDHKGLLPKTIEQRILSAKNKFNQAIAVSGGEKLASCSDDYTIMLWPAINKPSSACSITNFQYRLSGHQQAVNQILFSPDARYLASASFDHSVRLWDVNSGKIKHVCRGHVSAVYQVAFSADSRLFVSASKDSTLKCWSTSTGKLAENLPGHEDQVFAVDWSPEGGSVISGGKDRVVKIWKH